MSSFSPSIVMPQAPSVVAGYDHATVLTDDGELLSLTTSQAAKRLLALPPPLLIHAPSTLKRLKLAPMPAYDLLELFAFVRPAQSLVPTPTGLALALDLPPPTSPEDAVMVLQDSARVLLQHLCAAIALPLNRDAAQMAARMGMAGWGWAPYVLAALGHATAPSRITPDALKIWRRLPEWEETAPPPPPSALPVHPAQARARLAQILGDQSEQRPSQADFASAATAAFAPRETCGDPHLVLAEAGTGTGKTLGYIAPASLWAEQNHGSVWISTYTRHLQRQIDNELTRLFPDPAERRRRVVVRKGRENYLCLLNYEDTLNAALNSVNPAALIPLGLIARWTLATSDGDIAGGDLPGWFIELFGPSFIAQLVDRRGECIHGACSHYRVCFGEHTIRRARTAELVVANHALAMAQAAWGGLDDNTVPTRYVFDEGHHLFDAADSAFSAELSGLEGAELRRWLLGAEGGRSRARGLRRRLEDLVAGRPELEKPLDAALRAAHALPAPGWTTRLQNDVPLLQGDTDAVPASVEPIITEKDELSSALTTNPMEHFLQLARRQVLARAQGNAHPGHTLECDLFPTLSSLPQAALGLRQAIEALRLPLLTLTERLLARLETEADELDAPTRARIEAMGRSIRRRALDRLSAWQAMLRAVEAPPPPPGERPDYIQFLHLDRRNGTTDRDVGLHRHPLDPTIPFITSLAAPAHGLLVASATLRDNGESDPETAWLNAEERVGAPHLPSPAIRVGVPSPFDYARQTLCLLVNDVGTDIAPLAAAYRTLFLAAGGGGLGLFTAIRRLQAVQARIAPDLEAHHIPLLAQHVDAMDNATLVDIFRTEHDSCLLGTDAMRDGVDVPGRALRLVVFDRVPWPRPDILHRERRVHLSGGDTRGYDDRIARMRLRQAFGRLIRSAEDRGVFVLLDRRMPTRLYSAFPAGVEIRRTGLADAARMVTEFLGTTSAAPPVQTP